MFHTIYARALEAVQRLGLQGLSQPPAHEDDGAFLHVFGQLTDKLVEDAMKLTEVINAEYRELLGLAGARIFSNLQRLLPDLDLLYVLQRREAGTPPALRTVTRSPEQRVWT
jgi:hypothetical protein